MARKSINLTDVSDIVLRSNFEAVRDIINLSPVFSTEWKFFEVEITDAAAVTKTQKHGFSITPRDIIQTYKTGAGAITFNYASFDNDNISFTTTGPCKVRFLVGTISNGRSNVI